MLIFKTKEVWSMKLNQIDKKTIQAAKKLLALNFIFKVEIKKETVTIYTISGLCQSGKEPFINQIYNFFFENKKAYSYFQIPIKLQNNNGCQNKKCCYTSCPIIIAAYFWYDKSQKRNKKEEQQIKEQKESYLLECIEKYQLLDLADDYKKLIAMLQSRLEDTKDSLSLHYYLNATTIDRAYNGTDLLSDILYEYKVIEYKLPIIDIEKVLQGEQEWVEHSECIFIHLEQLHQIESGNQLENQQLTQRKRRIIDFLEKNSNHGIFVLIGIQNTLDKFLKEYPKLQITYNKKYTIPDLSTQSITNYVMTLLHEHGYECELDFEQHLYQYIHNNYKYSPFHNFEYGTYLYRTVTGTSCSSNKQVYTKQIPPDIEAAEPATLITLNEFIGLANVKKEVKNLREFLIYNQKVKSFTDKTPILNLHMMFLGNPGTGKTTVARLIAQLLYELGYIRTNKVIEADKKTFTGQYVGQSTVKTKEVLEKAMGGVLFIDEAYALGEPGSFNEEIVATIIKVMEDYRDELIIIFAGYTKSMQQFFDMNEGLRSRIGRTLYFDDYTADELTEITVKKLKDIDYTIDLAAMEEIKKICEGAIKQVDFGNGRFADLFVQKIVRSHASLYQEGKDILYITKNDVIHAKDLL